MQLIEVLVDAVKDENRGGGNQNASAPEVSRPTPKR
jgi:hypothetical protein